MSTPTTLIAHRYRLVKMLGTGGMGVVWQAWDERLHRPVALKMLRAQPEIDDSERELATERAMREARITAGLHHPHAVTVFDVIEHEGRPCIVMQLIESTPLSALLKEHGPMTPSQTARIGAEVASALAAAHKLRIVHRDVKPGNVLITDDGSALISDFGISHALGDATITATGLIHGTPAYLAPEVAKGLPTSFASDVFSLGSTIYTMLEGTPPFGTDSNAISLLHKVARGGYDPPRNAGPLAPLLKQMLATNPKRRPTMVAVAETLSETAREARQPEVFPDGVAAVTAMLNGPDPADLDATTQRIDEPLLPAAGAADDGTTEAIAEPPATTAAAPAAAVAAAAASTGSGAAPPVPHAETARTVPADQPTRFEPPTAATEHLPAPIPVSQTAETEPVPPAPPMPPAPSAAAPAVPPTPAAPPDRRRRSLIAGILILVGVLVLGAAVLFNPWRSPVDEAGTSSPSPAASTSQPTPTPEPGAAPPAASEPAPTPTETQSPPQPTPANPEQRVVETISGYYAMLPADLDAAWPLMTADYQENHAGGRGGYEEFWSNVASVEITDVSASAPDRGQATLTYHFTDGRVVQEVTSYRLVDEGGVLKIAETDVVSSVQL